LFAQVFEFCAWACNLVRNITTDTIQVDWPKLSLLIGRNFCMFTQFAPPTEFLNLASSFMSTLLQQVTGSLQAGWLIVIMSMISAGAGLHSFLDSSRFYHCAESLLRSAASTSQIFNISNLFFYLISLLIGIH
jgi:hypothetical protein